MLQRTGRRPLPNSGNSIDAVASLVYTEHPDLKKHAAPDGTVTIMFSDIEGSTAMADRLGDKRFMDVLREHNAIIREQINAFGPRRLRGKERGRRLHGRVPVGRQSPGCAAAIQTALAKRNKRGGRLVKSAHGPARDEE